MNSKLLFPLFAFGLILVMGIYFLINPSYERSIEAKYYYETGDYKEAYTLAQEAFSLDVYNRMASTIMAQSRTSLKYVEYIEEAKSYMLQVNEIAQKDLITKADRARMRIMSEIIVKSYVKLAPSIITDTELVEEAAKQHKNFKILLEKVTR